ncbi:MAG: VOC family protein [Proteobacteria bacterium]|nr:VOC family protein [Pseudomonadota bacterium]
MVPALDHLVIACNSVAEGVDWFTQRTGVAPVAGGKHPTMGTHNAVVRLGADSYVELIALDPDAPKPAHPRWFALDTPAMQASLAAGPRLIHWALRVPDIAAAAARAQIPRGDVQPFARGDLRWRLTVPTDGALPAGGVAPTLIQWDSDPPVARLPANPLTLAQFAASHPEPARMREDIAALGAAALLPVTYANAPRIAVMLRTPRGVVAL